MAEGGEGCTESENGYSSLYSRHSRNHLEIVSMEICTIMTRLGYGEMMRRWRVEKYREYDRLLNARVLNEQRNTIITAGSKAEGLTCFLESDWDVLFVLTDVLCVEADINLLTISDDIDVFRMDTMDTLVYPGHCRLLQERPAVHHTRLSIIIKALCDNGYGGVLLSSSLLLDEYSALSLTHNAKLEHHERAGPSIPGTINGVHHIDRVIALRCSCPSILQRWADRRRKWPSPNIVQKVVSLGAFVTPVGFKGSDYKDIEWRICFNNGEAELVNNLNDTQAKVYVILKMILRDIIKPNKKEITSYMLKNIILWQAENTPQTQFHSRRLLYWLHDGLKKLRTAIEEKRLCYYMIPERNLMEACGMHDYQQHKWVADITDMLEEGPNVFLRLKKLRKAIVASPEPMMWFSKKRMELEMLLLEYHNRGEEIREKNGKVDDSDSILEKIWIRTCGILIQVAQRMFLKDSSANQLIDIYNRMLM